MRKSEVRQVGQRAYRFTQLPNREAGKLYLDIGPRIFPLIAQLSENADFRTWDAAKLDSLASHVLKHMTPEYLDRLIDLLIPTCEAHPKVGPHTSTWMPLEQLQGMDYLDQPLEVLEWVRAGLEVNLYDFLSLSQTSPESPESPQVAPSQESKPQTSTGGSGDSGARKGRPYKSLNSTGA